MCAELVVLSTLMPNLEQMAAVKTVYFKNSVSIHIPNCDVCFDEARHHHVVQQLCTLALLKLTALKLLYSIKHELVV